MTQYFPIIVEQESNGSYSAWVAGLPGVYAAADTAADTPSLVAVRGRRGAPRPRHESREGRSVEE